MQKDVELFIRCTYSAINSRQQVFVKVTVSQIEGIDCFYLANLKNTLHFNLQTQFMCNFHKL